MTLAEQMVAWYLDEQRHRYADFSDGVLNVACARYQLLRKVQDGSSFFPAQIPVLVMQRLDCGDPGKGRFKHLLTDLEALNPDAMMVQCLEEGGRLARHLDNRGTGWQVWDAGQSRLRWKQ